MDLQAKSVKISGISNLSEVNYRKEENSVYQDRRDNYRQNG